MGIPEDIFLEGVISEREVALVVAISERLVPLGGSLREGCISVRLAVVGDRTKLLCLVVGERSSEFKDC